MFSSSSSVSFLFLLLLRRHSYRYIHYITFVADSSRFHTIDLKRTKESLTFKSDMLMVIPITVSHTLRVGRWWWCPIMSVYQFFVSKRNPRLPPNCWWIGQFKTGVTERPFGMTLLPERPPAALWSSVLIICAEFFMRSKSPKISATLSLSFLLRN